MTSIALHPAPSRLAMIREQLRAQGLMMRTAGAFLAAVFLLIGGACIRMAFLQGQAARGRNVEYLTNFTYTPQISIILTGLALIVPLMIWHDEEPARRLYHWAMPVAQPLHAFIKAFAGWLWLMAVVVFFLVGMALIPVVIRALVGGGQNYLLFAWWEWLIPLTSASIAYVFASAAAVGTRRPFVWIFGLPLLYGTAIGLVARLGMLRLARVMNDIAGGYYGAAAAMAGQTEKAGSFASADRWLVSSLIWGATAALVFYIVARRRVEPSS